MGFDLGIDHRKKINSNTRIFIAGLFSTNQVPARGTDWPRRWHNLPTTHRNSAESHPRWLSPASRRRRRCSWWSFGGDQCLWRLWKRRIWDRLIHCLQAHTDKHLSNCGNVNNRRESLLDSKCHALGNPHALWIETDVRRSRRGF